VVHRNKKKNLDVYKDFDVQVILEVNLSNLSISVNFSKYTLVFECLTLMFPLSFGDTTSNMESNIS
jgi:hypothetical protein